MKSYTWRDAINHSNLEPTTRHVLHVLACHINDAGESCYPSTWLTARETGLSENAVIKHLKSAEMAGWLIIRKHGYAGQKWARNEYYPRVPDDFVPRDYKAEKAEEDAIKAQQRSARRALGDAEKVTAPGSVTSVQPEDGEVTAPSSVTIPGESLNVVSEVTEPDEGKSLNHVQSNYSVELSKEPPVNPHSPPAGDGVPEDPTVMVNETPPFDRFWLAYPNVGQRKVAKAKCAAKWKACKLDAKADEIIAHVQAMTKTDQWKRGYEPAPLTYLNQSRWEDPIPTAPAPAQQSAKFDPFDYVMNRHKNRKQGGDDAADFIDI